MAGIFDKKGDLYLPIQQQKTTQTKTKDYRQRIPFSLAGAWSNCDRPPLTHMGVERMLTDPVVNFGLRTVKGPIRKAEFIVEADKPDVKEFVEKTLEQFWEYDVKKLLRAMQYRWAGGEILYEKNEETGVIEFKCLKEIHPYDLRALTRNNDLVGIRVYGIKNQPEGNYVDLFRGKFMWHAHDSQFGDFYGKSRLESAYTYWYPKWDRTGAVDSLHLWFRKYAFAGQVAYYPDEDIEDETGQVFSARSLITEIIEKAKSGATLYFPDDTDDQGKRRWELVEAQVRQGSQELFAYPKWLDDGILLGIGVPPEIVQADGTGAFAGRQVPQESFYSTLEDETKDLLQCFKNQLMKPLLAMNAHIFGKASFTVKSKPLVPQTQQENPGQQPTTDGAGLPPRIPTGDRAGLPVGGSPSSLPILPGLRFSTGGELVPVNGIAEDVYQSSVGRAVDLSRQLRAALLVSMGEAAKKND